MANILQQQLQEHKRKVYAAQSDYEVLAELANTLATLANSKALSSNPKAAQVLRDIAIESVNHKPHKGE